MIARRRGSQPAAGFAAPAPDDEEAPDVEAAAGAAAPPDEAGVLGEEVLDVAALVVEDDALADVEDVVVDRESFR